MEGQGNSAGKDKLVFRSGKKLERVRGELIK